MEINKLQNDKFSDLNPSCMKENNMNCVNIFDTSLKVKRKNNDGFKEAIKLKRNFK